MTPTELSSYLKVMREAGVMQGVLTLDGSAKIEVMFAPESQTPDFGDAPEPGGWKSPQRLDSLDMFDREPVPEVLR